MPLAARRRNPAPFSSGENRLYSGHAPGNPRALQEQTLTLRPARFPAGDRASSGSGGDAPGNGQDTSLLAKPKPKTQRPPLYKVLLLNDDYTPMEFVVHVLERFFGMSHAQAFDIMLTVHKKGLAVVGVFSFEVAETKVAQVMDFARRHQHPLQCTMEKE